MAYWLMQAIMLEGRLDMGCKNRHYPIVKLLVARDDVETNSRDYLGKVTAQRWMELAAASSGVWECKILQNPNY